MRVCANPLVARGCVFYGSGNGPVGVCELPFSERQRVPIDFFFFQSPTTILISTPTANRIRRAIENVESVFRDINYRRTRATGPQRTYDHSSQSVTADMTVRTARKTNKRIFDREWTCPIVLSLTDCEKKYLFFSTHEICRSSKRTNQTVFVENKNSNTRCNVFEPVYRVEIYLSVDLK